MKTDKTFTVENPEFSCDLIVNLTYEMEEQDNGDESVAVIDFSFEPAWSPKEVAEYTGHNWEDFLTRMDSWLDSNIEEIANEKMTIGWDWQ